MTPYLLTLLLLAAPPEAGPSAVRKLEYKLHDNSRDRPVWVDVWAPAPDGKRRKARVGHRFR